MGSCWLLIVGASSKAVSHIALNWLAAMSSSAGDSFGGVGRVLV